MATPFQGRAGRSPLPKQPSMRHFTSASALHKLIADFYEKGKYTPLALKLATARGLTLWGVYKDPVGVADVFEVVP